MIRILTTTDDGQVEAGIVRLDGKKLSFEFNDGFDALKSSVEGFVCLDVQADYEEVTAADDPERWYRLLAENFTGSYLRAEEVDEAE